MTDSECVSALESLIESMKGHGNLQIAAAAGVLMVVRGSIAACSAPALLDFVCEFSRSELKRIAKTKAGFDAGGHYVA